MPRWGRQQEPQPFADLQHARHQQYIAGRRWQRERHLGTLEPLETAYNRRVLIQRRIILILAARDERIRADLEFAFGGTYGALLMWLDMHGVVVLIGESY